ncbi:MAG: hypothetical protein NTX03_15215 [Bacteroidetes bacterium]|nr:hypothetical protein [Bacteroidota bacterium]
MKRIFIFISVSILAINLSFAGGDKYQAAMLESVKASDTASSMGSFQMLSNKFLRIAQIEKTEWLPWYYAAYCNVMASYMNPNKKQIDEVMDVAQMQIDKADSIKPNNSEIYCIKAMIYSARIMVNPMSRGRKFGTMSNDVTKRAMELDSTNPRPYLLMGTGLYYTPKMFGGGKDKALPQLEIAEKKFDAFHAETVIAPHWGETRNDMLLEQCKEGDGKKKDE